MPIRRHARPPRREERADLVPPTETVRPRVVDDEVLFFRCPFCGCSGGGGGCEGRRGHRKVGEMRGLPVGSTAMERRWADSWRDWAESSAVGVGSGCLAEDGPRERH